MELGRVSVETGAPGEWEHRTSEGFEGEGEFKTSSR